MGLQQYRTLLLIITAVSALFIASPALQQLVIFPQTDHFTELSLLGPYHNATYPSNITANENYPLYLGVSNHLGACSYYVIEVKFSNQSQSTPDSFNHTNSELPPLGSLTVFVADNKTMELPIDFSLQYEVDSGNSSRLNMKTVTINNAPLNVNSTQITKDPDKGGFYGNLFFELWIYNATSNSFQYHERYVNLWLRLNP